MNTLFAALVLAASVTSPAFSFDARTGTCRSADGVEGLNVGVVGACSDLRGVDLAGRSFDDADLRGARFDGANLEGATFLRADLRGSHFSQANLNRAVLTGAKLNGALLDNASLVGAHLEHASLVATDLRGSDLRMACVFRAQFATSDLRGARFSQSKALLQGANWAQAVVDADTVQAVLVAAR
jgi:uncharacterized protein YjbI with pentapeptide repeats